MLAVKTITNFNDFLKIKKTWDELLDKSGLYNPYLTHDWFRIAYPYFKKNEELFLLLVFDQDEVIAIAPLLISKEKYLGLPVKKICFLENVHTPFQDIIIAERKKESLTTIIDFLHKNIQMWDILELKEIRSTSENINILNNLISNRNNFHHQFSMSRSWSIPTNMTLEEGLNKLKPKVRREFNRKIRRIEKLGELSFKIVTEPKEIERHLDIFFDFYEQSWKGKERKAEFYYKIARIFSERRDFILYCLCLNGDPIAYTCVLKFNSILFCLKTTFNPAYTAFSSGSIMFNKIFENAFNDIDIEAFDIGRGDEKYKLEFESLPVEQILFLSGHKKTVISFLFHLRFKLVLYLKQKGYFLTILKYLKDLSGLTRKIPFYVKNKLKNFRGNQQVNAFLKQLSLEKGVHNDNDYLCRQAEADDVEKLAVAMKVKRFADLKERLENEQCLLLMNRGKIEHYFWFSQNYKGCRVPDLRDNQIVLTELDPLFLDMQNDLPLNKFNMISNILTEQKFNTILSFTNSAENQKEKIFESLGFQKINNGKFKK
jgi:hypothetical protein